MTRKITRGLAAIFCGLESCLYLGNLNALRDWGHAKDYVEMQWLMLQQDKPKDYVIATGQQISVRAFVQLAAQALGIELQFQGEGLEEKAVVAHINAPEQTSLQVGDVVVRVSPKYFRPTEVETLLGDASKAQQELGRHPKIPQHNCARNDGCGFKSHAKSTVIATTLKKPLRNYLSPDLVWLAVTWSKLPKKTMT